MNRQLSRRDMILGTAVTAAALGGAPLQTAAQDSSRRSTAAPLPADKIPVAFLMDEASTMMDFAGPWEVFQDVAMTGATGYYLYTVAPGNGPYNTSGTIMMSGEHHGMKGLRFTPDYTVADAPQPRVIVMGAQMDFSGAAKIDWLRRVAPSAEIVLSVCTGNFIAAHAGLLDGHRATTHHLFYDRFENEFPAVQLVREQRVVDNGKYISGGGITAGIDAALHVVRRQFGEAIARKTIEYMEYREGPSEA